MQQQTMAQVADLQYMLEICALRTLYMSQDGLLTQKYGET